MKIYLKTTELPYHFLYSNLYSRIRKRKSEVISEMFNRLRLEFKTFDKGAYEIIENGKVETYANVNNEFIIMTYNILTSEITFLFKQTSDILYHPIKKNKIIEKKFCQNKELPSVLCDDTMPNTIAKRVSEYLELLPIYACIDEINVDHIPASTACRIVIEFSRKKARSIYFNVDFKQVGNFYVFEASGAVSFSKLPIMAKEAVNSFELLINKLNEKTQLEIKKKIAFEEYYDAQT